MKAFKQTVSCFLLCLMIFSAMPEIPSNPYAITAEAHSGRTDGSGGHRDNKNKSGLGYYHYHCGGHPAHLHRNGTCPYKKSSSSGKKSKKLTISNKTLSLYTGSSKSLKLSVSAGKAKWKSSNKKVASVSKKGKVVAKRPGKTTISATYKGKTVKCKVTVTKKPVPISAALPLSVRTVDFDYFSDEVVFAIKNTGSEPIIVLDELYAYDDSYKKIGLMYLPFGDSVTIQPGEETEVTFYDFSGDLLYEAQRLVFRLNIGSYPVSCYAEYTYDDNVPYTFTYYSC